MSEQMWDWPYSCEVRLNGNMLRWTSHDFKWSVEQSTKAFLAGGPPTFYGGMDPPEEIVAKVREAILEGA